MIAQFKIHDKVIYPAHGVAEIEEISEKLVGGNAVSFMKLVFMFKDMIILVPTYNVASIGIRQPSNKDVIARVAEELGKRPERKLEVLDFTPSGWNKRHKEYQMRIQTGDLLEIAKIYRDLMYVAQQKDLSFGERNLLQITEELLAQEIQVVKNIDRELVVQQLRAPFKQMVFHNEGFLEDGMGSVAPHTLSEASSI